MKFLVPLLFSLSFLPHLVKWSGNFHSDVIGNRELFQWQQILVLQFCIPVAVERERKRRDGKEEDKWLEIDKVLPKRMLLPLLTFLSPSLSLVLSSAPRCSAFLTSEWKNLLLAEKKFNMAIPVISLIAAIFSRCSAEAIRETEHLNDKQCGAQYGSRYAQWHHYTVHLFLNRTYGNKRIRIPALIKRQFQFRAEYLHR